MQVVIWEMISGNTRKWVGVGRKEKQEANQQHFNELVTTLGNWSPVPFWELEALV